MKGADLGAGAPASDELEVFFVRLASEGLPYGQMGIPHLKLRMHSMGRLARSHWGPWGLRGFWEVRDEIRSLH